MSTNNVERMKRKAELRTKRGRTSPRRADAHGRRTAGRPAGARTAPGRSRETQSKGRIAVILADLFEDSEFQVPHDRLNKEGYETIVIGTDRKKAVSGKKGRVKVKPDRSIDEVDAAEFDALVIPGGYSPDHLRTDPRMVAFTRSFFDAGKPVAAVCHGGSMLVEADVVRDRTVTSWPSIKTDLVNAGANWVDEEVVVDNGLVTSRKPDDIPAFNAKMLEEFAEGRHGAAGRVA